MVDNKIHVKISRDEFLKLDLKEQNWLLFGAIQGIDENGCNWARERNKGERLTRLQIWGASLGGGLGFIALLSRLLGVF